MESKAIQRYVRITPRKCNQVLELIRGQTVEEAQTTL
jgi:ribosomal protein L22